MHGAEVVCTHTHTHTYTHTTKHHQSCVSALGLLSLLVTGRASDIVGRKFLLLALVALLLSAFLYMAISPLPPVPENGHVDLTPFDAMVMPMVVVLVVIGVVNMSGSVLAKALVTDATAPLPST